MQSFLLTLAYDGASFAGWQRQDGFDTVQQRLEEAFEVLAGEPVTVHGAGRTDAGVHALGQCAHVRLPAEKAHLDLVPALNGNLPRDIAVHSAVRVPASFHARFSARAKRYLYRFVDARVRPVIARGHYHWLRRPVDIGAMREAARHLIGRHDFASFANNPGYPLRRGTVRTVHHLHLMRRPFGLDLVIQGDGFLYNMVRAIAGTLRDVGWGKCSPAAVSEILQARDRSRAGVTLEPGGLYLARVLYPAGALALDGQMPLAPDRAETRVP